jgi:hypothetical protein
MAPPLLTPNNKVHAAAILPVLKHLLKSLVSENIKAPEARSPPEIGPVAENTRCGMNYIIKNNGNTFF